MEPCKDCEVYEANIVELKEKISMFEDRVKHLEKVIDDQVAIIKDAADSLIREL